MMFISHIAGFLGLIALASGVALFVGSARNPGTGSGAARFFGIIIIILSLGGILCNGYYTYKLWNEGSSYYTQMLQGMEHAEKAVTHSVEHKHHK